MMSRMTRTRATVPAILIAALLAGCGHEAPRSEAGRPVAVHAVTAGSSRTARIVEAAGSLRAQGEAVLSGKVMGSVIEIRKQAGESVRRGEVLIVIDARDVLGQIGQAEGSLAQAKAAMVLAETNLKRFEQLRSRGSASQLELDQARFQYETTKGAVQQAEGAVATASSYKSYAEISSPFDGRIVDRYCDVGDLAAPGRPLIKVEDASRIRLHVSLPESELALALPGGIVPVNVPALGDRRFDGTIAEVVPAVDAATRTFLVKLDLPADPLLRSGLYAKAYFRGGPRSALRVPRAAVLTRGGLTGIFVADGDRATFRLVTVADGAGDSVEVLSGLREGARIIIAPPPALEEGSPLEVQG